MIKRFTPLLFATVLCNYLSAQEHVYDFFKFGNDYCRDQTIFYENPGHYLLLQGKHPLYGNELWLSDGTAAGTTLLKDCAADNNAYFRDFVSSGRLTYFNIYSKTGREMWCTDGTAAGTRKLKQSSYIQTTEIGIFNNWVFYTHITGNNNYEIRRADTTFSTDTLVAGYTRAYNGTKSDFVVTDSFLYYNYDVNIYRISKAMGTPQLFWQRSSTHGGDIVGLAAYRNAMIWHMRNYSTQKTDFYASTEVKNTSKILVTYSGWEYIKDYVTMGSSIYFTAGTDIHKVDVPSLAYTKLASSSNPFYTAGDGDIEVFNGRVYFQGRSLSAFRTELWSTNGAGNGTAMVAIIASDTIASVNTLKVAGNTLLFNAYTRSNGRELWKSQGTAASTQLLTDYITGAQSGIIAVQPPALSYKGKVIFAAYTHNHGHEPWISDGTANGTILLKDINNSFNYGDQEVGHFAVAGDYLYLQASDSLNGAELWRTTGDSAGTLMVQNISPDFLPTEFGDYAEYRNKLFISAFSLLDGQELYTSNGKTGSSNSYYVTTGSLFSSSSPHEFVVKEPYLYYIGKDALFGSDNLYRSDGSKTGTAPLNKGISNSYSNVSCLRMAAGRLFFSAQVPGKGQEPMVSDGTIAGTSLLKDINTGSASSSPAWFCGNDSLVFFAATDATGNTGFYRSNGTDQGTVRIFNFSQRSFQNSKPDTMFCLNGKVFMKLRYTGSTYPNTTLLSVWDIQTDSLYIMQPDTGEQYGSASNICVYDKHVVFRAYTVKKGFEPWITDGTAAGTFILKDIMPGTSSSNPGNFHSYNGLLYIAATDAAHGREAWISNGSSAGTKLLWDIEPGTGNGNPGAFQGYKGYVYLSADQGERVQSLFRIQADSCQRFVLRLRNQAIFNTLCANTATNLFAESGYDNSNIRWYRNDTLLLHFNDTLKTSLSGIYYVTADSNLCHSVSNSITIRTAPAFSTQIVFSPDSGFCEGSNTMLKQNNAELQTRWYWNNTFVNTGATYTTAVSGNFYALGINGFGCSDTSNILKAVRYPKPVPGIVKTNDTLFCTIDADSFQWFLNNIAVSKATSKFYKPQSSGNYKVEAYSKEGCKGVSAVYNHVNTSLPYQNTGNLKVYPNPVSDFLHIDADNITAIKIMDINGKYLSTFPGKNTLDVSALKNGVYIMEIYTDSRIFIGKFVKAD